MSEIVLSALAGDAAVVDGVAGAMVVTGQAVEDIRRVLAGT